MNKNRVEFIILVLLNSKKAHNFSQIKSRKNDAKRDCCVREHFGYTHICIYALNSFQSNKYIGKLKHLLPL